MTIQDKIQIKLSGALLLLLCMPGCIGNSDKPKSYDPAFFNINNLFIDQHVVPILVIGSGPAGLAAALYGARENIDVAVIEGGQPGGLLVKTTEVTNWPGYNSIMGPDIIHQFRDQVEKAGARFISDTVESIDLSTWPYTVTTQDGQVIRALSIVVATGARPKKLEVPGEDLYWGSGVTTCAVCDASLPFNRGKDAVVIGGGDSAVVAATKSAVHQKNVIVLVRKDRMRAAASNQTKLADYSNVSIMYNIQVLQVLGDGHHMTGVEVLNTQTQEKSVIPASLLYLSIGHLPNSELFKGKVTIDGSGYMYTRGYTQETSAPGVFAAGEVHDSRYRQAITSAGQGAAAGLDALTFLYDVGFTPAIANQLKARMAQQIPVATDTNSIEQIHSVKDLKSVLKYNEGLLVLSFCSKTCANSIEMVPVVRAVAQGYEGTVTFLHVDADQATELVKKYAVYQTPSLVILAGTNEQPIVAYDYPMTKDQLISVMDGLVAKQG